MSKVRTFLRRLMAGNKGGHEEVALLRAYQKVYSTEEGQKVINDIIHQSGVYQIYPDDCDPSFQLGTQAVGIHVIRKIGVSEDGIRRVEALVSQQEAQRANKLKNI